MMDETAAALTDEEIRAALRDAEIPDSCGDTFYPGGGLFDPSRLTAEVRHAVGDYLRPAFFQGRRYLSSNWRLGAAGYEVALSLLDTEIDEPLGLAGDYRVEGFVEAVIYECREKLMTPLQRLHAVRQKEGYLLVH